MREKENFRPMLARIDEAFPNKEHLTIKDCFTFIGVSRPTFNKRYPSIRKNGGATKIELAKLLS